VLITSFQHAGEDDSDEQATGRARQRTGQLPVETISLNFVKIEFSYRPRKTEGGLDNPIKAGYDTALAKII
jgi:type VI protein secretion system component Hcp